MRIAFLSKANQLGGGASRAAEVLARGLASRGHHTCVFTVQPHPPTQGVTPIFPERLRRSLAYLHAGSEIVTGQVLLPLEYPKLRRLLRDYDVVHVQDTWTAFSPLTLRWIAERWPTAWTLHDCSAFTGGCLYMYECQRHKASCGRCPRKPLDQHTWLRRLDFTRSSILLKRRVHAGVPYHVITPSRWMAERAVESGVFSRTPTLIPHGADLGLFSPERRAGARTRLGLTGDDPLLLVAASSLHDPRKGVDHALRALDGVAARGLRARVLLLGHGGGEIARRLRLPAHPLGHLADPEALADAYAAADAFVFPTRADNLPLSVQESMASGTPVVAYAVGGVPEMIRSGETGILVPDGDVEGLSAGLTTLLSDAAARARMSAAAATHARREWSIEQYCERHLALYDRVRSHRN